MCPSVEANELPVVPPALQQVGPLMRRFSMWCDSDSNSVEQRRRAFLLSMARHFTRLPWDA